MSLTLVPNQAIIPLQHRLRGLRSRFRFVVILREGSLALALFSLAVIGICWLDWRFHLPALVRAFALTGMLAGFAILVMRAVVEPLRKKSTLLAMAQQVEDHFPHFNDALTSAIQFLEVPEEDLNGSPILRREAIENASDYAGDLDFSQAVSSRWSKRSFAALAIVIVGGLWIADRAPDSGMALERLFVPFGSQTWPAKTRIEILAPSPLPHLTARGEALEIQFRLQGVIPDRARFSLWLDGASPSEQIYALPKNESAGETTLSIHLEANRIPRSFKFRLRANDADTGWQGVTVLPPPALAPRDGRPSPQIHLTYPQYTELPAVDLPDGSSAIDTATGTRVQIRASVDRPIARVWLRCQPDQRRLFLASAFAPLGSWEGLDAATSLLLSREVWGEIPVAVSNGALDIDIDFVPRLSGTYVLHLEDETGISANRQFEIRVQRDPSPTVLVERPTARDGLYVLPDAEITLVALAHDKTFALRRVYIEYRHSENEPYQRQIAFDGGQAQAIIPQMSRFIAMPLRLPPAPFPRMQAYVVVRQLPISKFAHANGSPLKEGDVLRLRVAADDYDNVTVNKPLGASADVEIQIVSISQLDAVLQQRLTQMRNNLIDLTGLQQEARGHVKDARQRLNQSNALRREDLANLVKAEQTQQQIQARIAAKDEGLLAEANRLKQTVMDNRLPRSTTTQRIDAIRADLKRLSDEELPAIEPLISLARREMDKAPTPSGKAGLTRAEAHQKEVEETLRSLLERLEPWSGAGEMRGEARSILSELRRQMELLDQMQQNQQPGSVGLKRNELPAETRSELDRAAVRPEQLGERVRQLLEKIERQTDEKERAIKEAQVKLQAKERDAKAKADEAARQPKNSPAEQSLRKQSEALRDEAEDLRATIAALKSELEALTGALKEGDPQALRSQAQSAPKLIKDNHLGDARSAQQQVAHRLEKLVGSLEEKSKGDENDLLQKKRKHLDNRLDQLIADQELLQKKIDDAKKIADPDKRAEALRNLTPEQERLERAARELAQQLNRTGDDAGAKELRDAARQMEDARQLLDQGMPPDANQEEALNHLDKAQEQLERNREPPSEELIREQLAKAADQIRGLRERQFTAIELEKRLTAKAIAANGWDVAAAKQSLPGLIQQQEAVAAEVRLLIDKRFVGVPVFSRMLRQSAEAMDRSASQLKARESVVIDQLEGISEFSMELEEATHQRIATTQEIALKRLDQLLEALKPDKEMFKPQPPKKKAGDPPMQQPKGPPSDSLPPLAQLKALRSLQADVGERTATFDKAHADRSKLSEDEVSELELLQKAQIDVAELVKTLTPDPAKGDQP